MSCENTCFLTTGINISSFGQLTSKYSSSSEGFYFIRWFLQDHRNS